MTNLLDQLNKAKSQISLPASRKASIKISLMDQMKQAPKRVAFFSFFSSRAVMIGAICLVVILSGAATASASQVALPGDALYPVKVSVVEKVQSAFARTDQAQAELALNQLEERMDEGVVLAAHDSLDDAAQIQLDDLMSRHAEKFQSTIQRISADNEEQAVELNSRYQAIIAVHNQALQNLSDKSKLSDSLAEQSDEAAQVGAELEDQATSEGQPQVAAQNKLNATNQVIIEVQNYLNQKSVNSRISADSKASANAKLKAAQDLYTQAQAQLTAQKYKEVFDLANQAIRTAQEAKAQIRFTNNVQVELNNSNSTSKGKSNSGNGNNSPSFQTRLREHWSNSIKLQLGK